MWASDSAGGGIALVRESGVVRRLGSGIHEPNGFSRRKNGTFVVAGLEDHAVYEIAPDGTTTVLLEEVDGRPLGVVNRCWVDEHDRLCIGVMTSRAHVRFPIRDDGSLGLRETVGADRKTVYVGSLAGTDLMTFRAPVAG